MKEKLATALLSALMASSAFAQQVISVGQSPGSGTGDPAHVAIQKVNANIAELYKTAQPALTILHTSAAASQTTLAGSGEPKNIFGINGQRYIDLASGNLWVKAAGAWLLDVMKLQTRTMSVGGGAGSGSQSFSGPFWLSLHDPGTNGWLTSIGVSPYDGNSVLVGGDLFKGAYSANAGNSWYPFSGLPGQGDPEKFTWHPTNPGIVWMANGSGPFLSLDGGRTWASKRQGMPVATTTEGGLQFNFPANVSTVLFDPTDPTHQTLLAFGGSHRGATNDYPAGSDTPTTLFSNGKVWRSTDGGTNWDGSVSLPATTAVFSAGFTGNSSHVFAAGRFGGVFRSTDAGLHWTAVNNGGVGGNYTWFIVTHPTVVDTLWTVGNNGDIYKTTNGGDTWAKVHTGKGHPFYFTNSLSVSRLNPNIVWAAVPEGVLVSSDGGNSFHAVLDGSGVNDPGKLIGGTAYTPYMNAQWVEADPTDWSGNTAFAGIGAAIVRTTNRGATWFDKSNTPVGRNYRGNGFQGAVATHFSWNPFRPQQMFGLGADLGKMLRTDDYAWSWNARVPLGVAAFGGANYAAYANNGAIYIATGQDNGGSNASDLKPDGSGRHGLLKSTDWGATWGYVPLPDGVTTMTFSVYCTPSGSSVWVAVANGIYRSNDGGNTWSFRKGDLGAVFSIASDPTDSSGLTFYLGTRAGVYKTTDGDHFSLMPGSPASGAGVYVAVDPGSPTHLFVAQSLGGGLYVFDGSNWSLIRGNGNAKGVTIDPGNPRRIAFSTADSPVTDITRASGVWLSSDGGSTWTNVTAGLQNLALGPIAFNPDRSAQLVTGLTGGGLFVTDVGSSTAFGGKPRAIAGTIQAEDYDAGGEGVAYHSPGNHPSSAYRTSDNAGVCPEATGQALCSIASNSWIKYRANVAAGAYGITLRAKSAGSPAYVHLEMNGVNITGPIALPTGGSYGDVVVNGVELSGGTQYLKLYVEAGPASVDSIQFTVQ